MISKQELCKQVPALEHWPDDCILHLQEILGLPKSLKLDLLRILEARGIIAYADGPHGDPVLVRGSVTFQGALAVNLHNALTSFTQPVPRTTYTGVFYSDLTDRAFPLIQLLRNSIA